MEKITKLIKSRQFWTLAVLFVVNGVTGIRDLIGPEWMAPLDALLGFLIILFRIKPRQDFTP